MKLPEKLFQSRLSQVIGVVVLLLIFGAAIRGHFFQTKARGPQTVAAPLAAGSYRVTKSQLEALQIIPVQAMTFRGEQVTDGMIANNDDAATPVFSPFSGRVAKLYAKQGDVLAKGAPLMAVDASELVQGQNDLVAAHAAFDSASAQVKLAETSEKRQHELYLANAGALKDWLQSQGDLVTSQNNLRSAVAALEAVRNRLRILGRSEQEINAMGAESNSHQMNAEAILRAPIAGTVIQRQVGLGQYIQSASGGAANPVFAIGNLSTVWMIANVREVDTPLMQLGQAVEVRVPAWPNRVFKTKINWVASTIDPNTHRLSVRAEVDNRDGALKPMMSASLRILSGVTSNAAGVPQNAVVYEGVDAHVFVVRDDGSLIIRPIHVGRVSDDIVEIIDGLTVGERIVSKGALFIDRAAAEK
jgi:cobalt-zinc-cadmium efflux system membrane fusion protein